MDKFETTWAGVKSVLDSTLSACKWIDESSNYHVFAIDGSFSAYCLIPKNDPPSSDQTDFETNYKATGNQTIKANVTTQFERSDIVLKIARGHAFFDETGAAEISLKVPGASGSGDGRYVNGGFAITDKFGFGDTLSRIAIIDVDNILGAGAETLIQTYTDEDMPASGEGWPFWPTHQGCGECEITPLGYYGFLPSGLYLEIYFQKTLASSASEVVCGIDWGRHYS